MVEKQIFITGLGAVTPLGFSVASVWEALLQGRDAVADFDRFDLGGMSCRRAGQIRAYRPPVEGFDDLAGGFAVGACCEALGQAGGDPGNLGLVTASNFGPLDLGERGLAEERQGVLAACAQTATTEQLAQMLGLEGPRAGISLSCAAGAGALACAADWLTEGRAERLLVVGFDALSRCAWSGLCSLRTMTRERIRPFDRERSGTIFSEGAAAVLLERRDVCERRKGRPLAVLSGWATGNNGFHMTAPPPRAAGSAQVMAAALQRAGLNPEDIDHINAHGTGTKPNDSTESEALHDVFGAAAERIPVTANKSGLGHMLGAAGVIECIASVLSLRDGVVPPTINFRTPDPACRLDVVHGAPRALSLRRVLSNSAGFGGCNAAVVVESADDSRGGDGSDCSGKAVVTTVAGPREQVVITGVGVLGSPGLGRDEFAAAWEEGEPALFPAQRADPPPGLESLAGEVPAFDLKALLPTPKAYLDRQSALLLAAAAMALRDGAIDVDAMDAARRGLSMGAAWGALETLERFFADFIHKGPRLVKPMLFPQSYSNAAISMAAIEWEFRGPHLNFVSGCDSSSQALLAACDTLRHGRADLMLAGGAEALGTVRWRALAEAGRGVNPGEGAAVLVLERGAAARARKARILATLAGGAFLAGRADHLDTTCRDTLRRALEDSGIPAAAIRGTFSSAAGDGAVARAEKLAIDSLGPENRERTIPAEITGNLDGVAGAMAAACALLHADAARLPALVLSADPRGTAAALVLAPPA